MPLAAALVLTLLPSTAHASGVTWYRTGTSSGLGSFATLAPSATGASWSTAAAHGSSTGSFRFSPGGTISGPTAGPALSASGSGYATGSPLEGTYPAGTWRLGATVETDVPAGVASGHLLVALYRVAPSGSSVLVGILQGSDNVLATPGTRTVELTASLPDLRLTGEHLVTEWYLVVTGNTASPGSWTTRLRQGAVGDTVTVPAALVPAPVTPPSTLTVTGVGDNRVSLAWNPSSDARVTGYVVRRATAPTGPWSDASAVVAGLAHSDTGLVNGVRYYHAVVAVTADGTRSVLSNATSAVPVDTEPPDPARNLRVTPDGSGRLAVTWTAAAAGDVVGYDLERSGSPAGPFARVAGPVSGTSFTDVGLPAASTWYYRVIAIDDDGLRSAPTEPSAGTVAPSTPTGLRVVAVADGAIALAWSGTGEPVVGYRVERAPSATGPYLAVGGLVGGTSFTDGALTNGTTYHYRVSAEDASGARSTPTTPISGVPVPSLAPAPPTTLAATALPGSAVRLDWGPSPSSTVVGYRVLRGAAAGGPYADVSGLRTSRIFIDTSLPAATPRYYVVVAEDAAGTRSIPSTEARYTVPPSAPTGLWAPAVSETTAWLRWNEVGEPVAGYRVLRRDRDGTYAPVSGLVAANEFRDGGLLLGREYFYVVQAEAADGTRSTLSNEIHVLPLNGPPTPPTGLQVTDTGAGGQLRVTWAANLEPDVVEYRVRRAPSPGGPWLQVARINATTYLDGGLVDGTRYHYEIVAVDDVGFVSGGSTVASGVPSDTTPPPPPAGVIARSWPTYVDVAWSQAQGAVGYRVLRATASGGPYTLIVPFQTTRSFRDHDVASGTTYYYVVVARDAAGNESPPSGETQVSHAGTVTIPRTPSPVTPPDAVSPPLGNPLLPGFPSAGAAIPPRPGPRLPALPPDPPAEAAPVPPEATRLSGIALAEIPQDALAPSQPMPPRSRADEALALGRIGETVARSVGEVAGNVQEVARVFRLPLFFLLLLLAYAIVQGRIEPEVVPSTADVPSGAPDDEVEYLL